MNNVVLMGRLTRDPEVRYSQGENPMAVAKYTLAVDRRGKKGEADFISCTAFGKSGEFAEKYLKKGTKILVQGRIQTGSYTNREGAKVYTTDVVVENHEFVESRKDAQQADASYGDTAPVTDVTQDNWKSGDVGGGFMDIPDVMSEDLPFA